MDGASEVTDRICVHEALFYLFPDANPPVASLSSVIPMLSAEKCTIS